MSDEQAHVRCEVESFVATLTIDRPDRLNAFNVQTLAELTDAFVRLGDERDVGVIVLTGAGTRAFSAGGDVKTGHEVGQMGDLVGAEKLLYAAMRDCRKPTIARVNGLAIGGGNILALFCDFTIAAEHAVFGNNAARVGARTHGWLIAYLARVVGAKRARELVMLCRRYSARQMYDWGLVNEVAEGHALDACVAQWCADLLALSPSSLKLIKRSFDDEYANLRTLQDATDYLAEVFPGGAPVGEHEEGMQAFLERRAPNFLPYW